MSVHYLLDGYNILHQVPALMHGSLQARREALVRWLNIQRPQGSVRNRVTLVFDGSREHFGHMDGGGIKVVFSDGESADACIKAMVESSRSPKDLVIVSDDKDIKLYARALGAGILSVKQFMAQMPGKKTGQAPRQSDAETGQKISLSQAQRINQELERKWIKDGQ